MLSAITQPNYPKAALGFGDDRVTAVALSRTSPGYFSVKQAASMPLPLGLINPGFVETNISDGARLADLLERVAEECGLRGQKHWSVSLPSASARTAILSLKELPASRKELEEVLDFKAETSFGVPSAALRTSVERIGTDWEGRTRFFATAVKISVIDEFETVFESLGWRAGLILPRAVSEMNWLTGLHSAEDALLISSQQDGFTALLLRNGEPALVRSVICGDKEIDDEIYRLLVYYKDKYEVGLDGGVPGRFLLISEGALNERFAGISAEALGTSVRLLGPTDVGLDMPGNLRFTDIAAPAGLAALGWR